VNAGAASEAVPPPVPSAAWTRWARRAAIGGAAAAGVAAIGILAAGWYFATELDRQGLRIDHSPDAFDLTAAPAGDGVIRLSDGPAGGGWTTDGTYGLEWAGGYGQVTAIRARGEGWVERDFRPMEGTLTTATAARVDGFAFPTDPAHAFGYEFNEVAIAGELGAMPAWLVPGIPGEGWVIFVHGQNANRREALRSLRAVHDAGLTSLVITYRNDEGAPRNPDERLHYGETEWRDLDAAVTFAREHGARRIVVNGFSMGGGIALAFLLHSEQAGAVSGVILDAPMLDFRETVEFRAPAAVPVAVLRVGEWIAGMRFDIDWGATDYAARAREYRVPMLILQGNSDTRVPPAKTRAFAAAVPGPVTFVETGAGHVRSWNEDPARYESALATFLAK